MPLKRLLDTLADRQGLAVVLGSALVQAAMLYALHRAVQGETWPATEPSWLLALYGVALVVPLSLQLLAPRAGQAICWGLVAALGLAWFGFGWWHGATMAGESGDRFGEVFALLIQCGLIWGMLLPFLQVRIESGRWRPRYTLLFQLAWRNHLVLAEALAFTGAFWALLGLWQGLFRMLGIRLFSDIFGEPLFIYTVTPLVFALALHLIGSIEQLSRAVLAQVLGVLKWLLPLAAVILALFSLALLAKLPALVIGQSRTIEAGILLWLVAVVVLFTNAAYRDGSDEAPWPPLLARATRLALPLLPVIALTAAWSIGVRVLHYGWTAERVWAAVVAAAALVYAIGYAVAALRGGAWMRGMGTVNIATALLLIGALVLMQLPVFSPWRIAADSQYARVLAWAEPRDREWHRGAPLHYLRFAAGSHGRERLEELQAAAVAHPDPAALHAAVAHVMKLNNAWEGGSSSDALARIEGMAVYPAGRALDPGLRTLLAGKLEESYGCQRELGLFVDLDGEAGEEFVLLAGFGAEVYAHRDDRWQHAAGMMVAGPLECTDAAWTEQAARIARGEFVVESPAMRSLRIGERLFEPHSP